MSNEEQSSTVLCPECAKRYMPEPVRVEMKPNQDESYPARYICQECGYETPEELYPNCKNFDTSKCDQWVAEMFKIKGSRAGLPRFSYPGFREHDEANEICSNCPNFVKW